MAAWRRWSNRNLRGESVRFDGVRWEVVTHISNGVWRVTRLVRRRTWVRENINLKFDNDGKVLGRG